MESQAQGSVLFLGSPTALSELATRFIANKGGCPVYIEEFNLKDDLAGVMRLRDSSLSGDFVIRGKPLSSFSGIFTFPYARSDFNGVKKNLREIAEWNALLTTVLSLHPNVFNLPFNGVWWGWRPTFVELWAKLSKSNLPDVVIPDILEVAEQNILSGKKRNGSTDYLAVQDQHLLQKIAIKYSGNPICTKPEIQHALFVDDNIFCKIDVVIEDGLLNIAKYANKFFGLRFGQINFSLNHENKLVLLSIAPHPSFPLHRAKECVDFMDCLSETLLNI